MRLIAIIIAALALTGCSAEYMAQRETALQRERAQMGGGGDSALQDYAAFMSAFGNRAPQMDPSSVLFMQPRHYPPLIGGKTCTRYGNSTVC